MSGVYVATNSITNENSNSLSTRDFTNNCVSYLQRMESEKNLFRTRLNRTIERLRNQNNDRMTANSSSSSSISRR